MSGAGSRRGRRTAILCVLSGIAVCAGAAWAFEGDLRETWHSLRLGSSDPWTSESAAMRLIELGSERSIPRLIRAARRHRYLESVLPRLSESFPPEALSSGLPDILEVLRRRDNPFEWMAITEALEGLGDRAGAALPALIEGFEYWRLSPDFGIHHRILKILGNHGPAARTAVPLLERALLDYDLESRRLAAEALEKIGGPRTAVGERSR